MFPVSECETNLRNAWALIPGALPGDVSGYAWLLAGQSDCEFKSGNSVPASRLLK